MSFDVTAAYDKPEYNQGDTIKVTISGADVHTVTEVTKVQIGPLTLTLTSADGETQTFSVPKTTVSVSTTHTTEESVKITDVHDDAPEPRTWTIDGSGLFVTTQA